ncbi:MAG: hypothetical protein Q9172_000694 [Xanthocarpia lactea]
MRYAELKPGLPASIFPSMPANAIQGQNASQLERREFDKGLKIPKKNSRVASPATVQGDEGFYEDDVADADMCEAGVDKPPKAPKRSTVTSGSREESKSKAFPSGNPKQNDVQSKLLKGKALVPINERDIEKVDLTQERGPIECAKVATRAYRSLHQLHGKVNKDTPKPTIANGKPTFSYKKGEQPTFTFLHQPVSSGVDNKEHSSDYGSGFLDDLPSPSALVRTVHKAKANLDSQNVDYDGVTPDHGNLACEQYQLGFDESDHQEPRTIDRGAVDPTMSADSEYEEATEKLSSEGCVEISRYFQRTQPGPMEYGTSHEKLFMSTDSPEKLSSPVGKRKTPASPGVELDEDHEDHAAKKTKFDSGFDSAVIHPPSSKKAESLIPAPMIEPGHPAPVDEFDEAFIAEWEPYAKFV